MKDGSLSQEEIDALLAGTEDDSPGAAPDASSKVSTQLDASLSIAAKNYLISNFNEAMGVAASSCSVFVGKELKISNTQIYEMKPEDVPGQIASGSIVVSTELGNTPSVIVLTVDQGKKIATGMIGSNGTSELDDAHLSALGEFSNILVSSISNNLGIKFQDDLAPASPLQTKIFSGPADIVSFSEKVIKMTYDMELAGESLGQLTYFMSIKGPLRWSESVNVPSTPSRPVEEKPTNVETNTPDLSTKTQEAPVSQQIMNPVNFPALQSSPVSGSTPPNYELLLDVQMVLTVELGRTTKYVKDVLNLGEGSIIELDKLAGEPVDLLVNGKLIAKGEVVVIDENFGVRVTDIVGPAERLSKLTSG